MREISLANAANSAFLACLRQRESEGIERAVGPHTGPNYAPSQFEGMPQAKGLKRAALKQAMDRLYQAGLIETKQVERPGKAGLKSIIVEASPNSPNALPNASRTRSPNTPLTPPEHPRTHSVYTSYIAGAGFEPDAPAEDEGREA